MLNVKSSTEFKVKHLGFFSEQRSHYGPGILSWPLQGLRIDTVCETWTH